MPIAKTSGPAILSAIPTVTIATTGETATRTWHHLGGIIAIEGIIADDAKKERSGSLLFYSAGMVTVAAGP
jgi:hypothetical protein